MKALFLSVCAFALVNMPGCFDSGSSAPRTGLVVVNVLDKALYDDCHIKGSISIPIDELEDRCEKELAKDATVVVYCSNYMCSASGYGRQVLLDRGYKDVHAYEGGTAEWYQTKLPVEGACTQGYLARVFPAPAEHQDGVITTQKLQQMMDA